MSVPILLSVRALLLAVVTVRTPRDLDALAIQSYLIGTVAAFAFLGAAAFIANTIAFEGGANPRDPGKRRLWFWALMILAAVSVFLYNLLIVASRVGLNLQSRFSTVNVISVAITAVAYVLVGFVLAKMFSTGKIGNWFPSRR